MLLSAPLTRSTAPLFGVRFFLGDQFGDGWGSASLFVYPSNGGSPLLYSLACGETHKLQQYCFDPNTHSNGDYIVVGILGYHPKEVWEVRRSLLIHLHETNDWDDDRLRIFYFYTTFLIC